MNKRWNKYTSPNQEFHKEKLMIEKDLVKLQRRRQKMGRKTEFWKICVNGLLKYIVGRIGNQQNMTLS